MSKSPIPQFLKCSSTKLAAFCNMPAFWVLLDLLIVPSSIWDKSLLFASSIVCWFVASPGDDGGVNVSNVWNAGSLISPYLLLKESFGRVCRFKILWGRLSVEIGGNGIVSFMISCLSFLGFRDGAPNFDLVTTFDILISVKLPRKWYKLCRYFIFLNSAFLTLPMRNKMKKAHKSKMRDSRNN